MRFFTVYIDRDVRVEAKGDAEAVALAKRLHAAVDRVIEDAGAECRYARSACQRGTHNKIIFDEERGEEE